MVFYLCDKTLGPLCHDIIAGMHTSAHFWSKPRAHFIPGETVFFHNDKRFDMKYNLIILAFLAVATFELSEGKEIKLTVSANRKQVDYYYMALEIFASQENSEYNATYIFKTVC